MIPPDSQPSFPPSPRGSLSPGRRSETRSVFYTAEPPPSRCRWIWMLGIPLLSAAVTWFIVWPKPDVQTADPLVPVSTESAPVRTAPNAVTATAVVTATASTRPVAPPPPAERLVRFESEPEGASLFLNGRLIGATPLIVEGLAPGLYGLRLEKSGREPRCLRLQVGGEPLTVREILPPLATGSLEVKIEPAGAEVLLDGELAGLTPLKLPKVPVGPHKLVVRKTNYRAYSKSIEVSSGQALVFSGFELQDLILEMLRGYVRAEPQRVAHYCALGRYLFKLNQMSEAAMMFARAEEEALKPLVFPERFSDEERAAEMRLRSDDRKRLPSEIEKLRGLAHTQTHDANLFYQKLAEFRADRGREQVDNWLWVEKVAVEANREGHFARAEDLLLRHLEKVPEGQSVLPALALLIESRLGQRNPATAEETLRKYLKLAGENPAALVAAGKLLFAARNRVRPDDLDKVLELAEGVLLQALNLKQSRAAAADCAFELGHVLMARRRPGEAVAFYEQAAGDAPGLELREERSLQWAEALRQAGRMDEARAAFKRLSQSENAGIRARALHGLTLLQLPPK